MKTSVRGLAFACVLFGAGLRPAQAQEVFRESTFNYGAPPDKHFAELDPDIKRVFTGKFAHYNTMKRHVPRPITLDRAQATRAEVGVEYFGGHIGTSGQRFRINGHEWHDVPQPVGTPTAPQRFFRTLLGNNAVPVPLAQLAGGENIVQFTAGPQIGERSDWGYYWIYDFTVRVYYDASRPHPTGEILTPKTGASFGDTLELAARASSPNGAIVRIEYIGEYDDFDWDGDGVWREWQFTTHHGVLQHHLGTATSAPWSVTWDARWIPDQTQPVRVRARITDASGMTYLTPPVENIAQNRSGRSVRMFKSTDVPERFTSRIGKASPSCSIAVDGDLAKAKCARLVVSTWSANTDDDSVHALRLNGETVASRFGQFHNYSLDSLEVPLALLKNGANVIDAYSTFKGHGIEVNWPGPVLMVEFRP